VGEFSGSTSRGVELRMETDHLALQLQHSADARQVEAFGQELSDPSEEDDVGFAVQPCAAGGAGRLQQAATFVDAEVLDREICALGRDRDREHGPGVCRHRGVSSRRLDST
jgi:hypothetical protein